MTLEFILHRSAFSLENLPLIKPHPQRIPPQSLRHVANDRLALRAVAQKDIGFEIVGHASASVNCVVATSIPDRS